VTHAVGTANSLSTKESPTRCSGVVIAYNFYLFHQTTDFAPENFPASFTHPHDDHRSSTHVLGHFDSDSDQGISSGIEQEEDWLGNPNDVQTGAQTASRVSQATNNKVHPFIVHKHLLTTL
jgi:hypothetical protein